MESRDAHLKKYLLKTDEQVVKINNYLRGLSKPARLQFEYKKKNGRHTKELPIGNSYINSIIELCINCLNQPLSYKYYHVDESNRKRINCESDS